MEDGFFVDADTFEVTKTLKLDSNALFSKSNQSLATKYGKVFALIQDKSGEVKTIHFLNKD